ncbi:MAG: cysteine desulfurase [Acidimicrobiales bacterium]|nr:cysteine desulfurase [Acidimicrobiales bacterium]
MTAYLDHAASSPLRPEALEAMLPWFSEVHANPTASHRRGRRARQALDDARAVIAEATGFERGEIVFTGGGTESDNMAIGRDHSPGTIIVGATEHPAVLEPAVRQHARIAAANAHGVVTVDAIKEVATPETEVVSVMAVNNELGVIQPVSEIAAAVHEVAPGARMHTDAVQALPWLDLASILDGVDVVSVTGHKLGGPQGTGAIAMRAGRAPRPLLVGGGQERDHRAGTQNVAGIVGFAAAVRASIDDRDERLARIDRLATRLLDGLVDQVDGVRPTVPRETRVPGILHVCIERVASEPLLFLLDERDLACSAASSCASGAQGASHVLSAMGLDTTNVAPLRLSLGWNTTEAEIDEALRIIPAAVNTIRQRSHG